MNDILWFPMAAALVLVLAAGLYLARRTSRRAGDTAWRPSFVAGILVGLATAGAVALTLPLGGNGSPAGDGGVGAPAPAAPSFAALPSPSATPQHASGRPLGAEAQVRVAALETRIATDPGDLLSRKELALLRLGHDQLMSAFEQASAVLQAQSDDPDGLYVHGVVRLRMGQSLRSIQLLERLLSRYPEHVQARVALGRAQSKIGDDSGAVRSWTTALAAAGGRHAEIERLLAGTPDAVPLTEERPALRLAAAHDRLGGGAVGVGSAGR